MVFVLSQEQIPAYVGRQVPCSKCRGVFTVVSDASGFRGVAFEAKSSAQPIKAALEAGQNPPS